MTNKIMSGRMTATKRRASKSPGGKKAHPMRIALLAVVLLWPLGVLSAQELQPLTVGARVRVTIGGPVARVQIGTFQALLDTALLLKAGPSPLTISLDNIERLELSRGHKASVVGGVVGLVVGAAAGGFVLGGLANRDDYGVIGGGQDDTKLFVGAALGGVVGAVLGATLFRRERWVPVDLPGGQPAGGR